MRLPGLPAALALLVVGAVAGVLGALGFRAMEPVPVAAHASENLDGEVASALVDLRRSIEGLPAALRAEVRAEPSFATERRPADASAESDVARLARAIERLEAALSRGGHASDAVRSSARGSSESWKGPGFVSLEAMRARVQELQRSLGEQWWDKAFEELARAHLLWTRDDVLDHYGAPRRVDPSNGLGLEYDQAPFAIGTETCGFKFVTNEGIVTAVEFECR